MKKFQDNNKVIIKEELEKECQMFMIVMGILAASAIAPTNVPATATSKTPAIINSELMINPEESQ